MEKKKLFYLFVLIGITCFISLSCDKNGVKTNVAVKEQTLLHEDSIKAKQLSFQKKGQQICLKACKWIEHTIDSIGFVYDKKGQEAFRMAFNNKMVNDKYFFYAMLRLGEMAEDNRSLESPSVHFCEFDYSCYSPQTIGVCDGQDDTKGLLVGKRFVCRVSNIKEKNYDGSNYFDFSYQIEGLCLNTNPKHIEWTKNILIKLDRKNWGTFWTERSIRDESTLKCGDFFCGNDHSSVS